MRLEFDPNTAALPFIENELANDTSSSEVERMLRAGIKSAQEGKRNEARNQLLRVTELDAKNENAWLWLASISEYPEELLIFLGNVLKVNPDNARALEWQRATKSLLAKTLVQRGIDATKDDRRDFARQCFEQALGHEAENEMAWLWLASISETEEEKTGCFEKVLSVNPENDAARASLAVMQARKTENLFNEALCHAFDGNHRAAHEMLAAVIEQNAEMENAWVLKAHLADSFEERAEAFLKLRALNPENKMANAALASWRALADKAAAARPKTEETSAPVEVESAAVAAPAETVETRAESAVEASADEEISTEFFAYPEPESFAVAEAKPEDFVGASEPETEPTAYFEPAPENEEAFSLAAAPQESFEAKFENPVDLTAEENSASAEYVEPDFPTEELNFPPDFDAAQFDAAPESEAQAAFSAESQETAPAFDVISSEEYRTTDFPAAETHFDASETDQVSDEEASTLAAELRAEEEKMHLAFAENMPVEEAAQFGETTNDQEFENQTDAAAVEAENFAVSPEILEAMNADAAIHETHDASIHETQFEQSEPFADMSAEMSFAAAEDTFAPENEHFAAAKVEAETAPVSEEMMAEPLVDENQAQEFAPAEEPAAETPVEASVSTEAVEMAAEVVETATDEAAREEFAAPAAETMEATTEAEMSAEEMSVPEEAAAEENTQQVKAEAQILCPFCTAENERQTFVCHSCQSVLTLSDLEMLLGWQMAKREKLLQAVESLERENSAYGLNSEQLAFLGIGHINLKNYRQGFFYLQEAVRLNPSNVVLGAQVNAMAIRLSEIEEHQTTHSGQAKNRKILVVDDSPTVRKLISGKLEKCGHEVVCAVDGVDALEKVNELTPDLILLDITMPRMDGYQVCKMLRSNEATKNVPVVMISGKDGFFDKVRGKMAGTTGYITKPFGPETLMKTVETYL